jgi:hypothetical protein
MACSTGSAYFSLIRTTLLFRGLAGPLAGLSALTGVVACSSAEDDEKVGQKVQTVIEGTEVIDARPGGHVLVQVQKDLLTAKRGSGVGDHTRAHKFEQPGRQASDRAAGGLIAGRITMVGSAPLGASCANVDGPRLVPPRGPGSSSPRWR